MSVLFFRYDEVNGAMSAPGKVACDSQFSWGGADHTVPGPHGEAPGSGRARKGWGKPSASAFIVGCTGSSRRGRANRLRVGQFEYWQWAPGPRNCPQLPRPWLPLLVMSGLGFGGFRIWAVGSARLSSEGPSFQLLETHLCLVFSQEEQMLCWWETVEVTGKT